MPVYPAHHECALYPYLYAENVSIENKSTQPVAFEIGLPFTLEDAVDARFRATAPFRLGTTFMLDYSEEPRGV